ncbi:hypothetical protein Tfer_0217 [Thermincola ferriacetica]|uniref:Adenosylcobinamide amidohydrolase n=1 Tax=Thermincola ferriacetica TaxID=281456 RepID=A0A0L6W6J3_9FIRM|nr:adenosylcobinamide amidohydrolase [Thermincola ferriacetica]KNZ71140.1 hypothetical protein Tfer_0217 [Thermincola ferriacetica]
MLIYETKSGEKVYRMDNTIIVFFPGPRLVISTSRINGGIREDLEAVFNHCLPPEKCLVKNLPNGSAEQYLEQLAAKLHLPPKRTAGLLTAARMENIAIKAAGFQQLEVTALVTAGVDVNGGRAGDPAAYHEADGQYTVLGGTINIILIINGNLSPYTLVRTVVTATEAKTAALQELMAPSRYSRGIATGSGTDQIIVVSNPSSLYRYTDAGKHSKLGELIGSAVKDAVKEALYKETGLGPERQRNFLARWARYGIKDEDFWQEARRDGAILSREMFIERLNRLAGEERLVTLAAALIHLLDEYTWGLLSAGLVMEIGEKLIQSFAGKVSTCNRVHDPPDYLSRLFIELTIKLLDSSAEFNC